MFDLSLRPLKDTVLSPLPPLLPQSLTPNSLTLLAFLSGLLSCLSATCRSPFSLPFWLLNRLLDCLDGAVARHRHSTSELGGFLDLLGDFVVYALVPISVAWGNGNGDEKENVRQWIAIACLEATFWINNFVLFYIAAVAEKWRTNTFLQNRNGDGGGDGSKSGSQELTSVMMKPALIEGFESGLFFTLMLAFPSYLRALSWVMCVGVTIGTAQRVSWFVGALARNEREKRTG
ncbi:hypothetical protein BCR34DRAFT_151693 [Clohesyomyces aquaticus]|uniref:CDP-alcohol phosphatidyltransferase-domain-containing protein n=1 Tax=Clohesyomyces aquaticus TaxID=1231657 RepID=A0A1Y1YJX3_9PLEO|nr:hypothetical protein BCR34DRAFT_151693 [Clohesyomyces aquaticus]